MVEIKNIKAKDTLWYWLEQASPQFGAITAHRAAMRVFPAYLDYVWFHKKRSNRSFDSFPAFWSSFVSGVESDSSISYRNRGTEVVARSALNRITPLVAMTARDDDSNFEARAAITSAAGALRVIAFPHNSQRELARVTSSAISRAAVATRYWEAARHDLLLMENGINLRFEPLWYDVQNPMKEKWIFVREILALDEVDWSFWIKWYEAALEGTPLGQELLNKIIQIPSKIWENGPIEVNRMIAKIEEEFLLAATPLAEKVELNPETGRLRIVPERMSQKALYSNILEKIRDGMADLRDSPEFDNALSALGPVFEKVLDRTFDKYLSSPQRVHDDFVKGKRRIQKLLDVGEVAPNDEVIELVEDLDSGAAHIRANMPQVRESMAALAALLIAEASDADVEGIRAGAEAIAAQSEPEMAEQMREDAAEIVASRDVPLGAPKVLAPEETYRLSHRIVESKQILTKANALKAGVVATGAFTGVQMIDIAVQILLRLLML